MKLVLFLLTLRGALGGITTTKYLIDQMSEQTTRGFGVKTDGTHICEPGYTGSDCTLKKCPYSRAFIVAKASEWLYTPSEGQEVFTVSSDVAHAQTKSMGTFENMHAYKECGGRGTCDRSTGQCKCFPSFTGQGCARTTCPNDCSGHGVCESDFFSCYGRGTVDQAKREGEKSQGRFWAVDKFRQCICDRGFHGNDCSLRTCPSGDDPETECSDQLATDRQHVICSSTGTGTSAWFSLRFKDQLGGNYRTRPIRVTQPVAPVATDAEKKRDARTIQDSLEALPNFVIPTVEVDVTTLSSPLSTFGFVVDFADGATTNKQHILSVDTSTNCPDSSQPKFGNSLTLTCTVTRLAAATNMKENTECGGRGLCDTSTGICSCFSGYYGDSCSQITTYV